MPAQSLWATPDHLKVIRIELTEVTEASDASYLLTVTSETRRRKVKRTSIKLDHHHNLLLLPRALAGVVDQFLWGETVEALHIVAERVKSETAFL